MNINIKGWVAIVKVVKVKNGYDAVIRVPFATKETAQSCLDELVEDLTVKAKEV